MSNLVFLDIETTGLISGYHEIIEIAIINEQGNHYHARIKPKKIHLADMRALAINGYKEKSWVNAIEPSQAAHEIADMLKGCTIVAHNPHFDMQFIEELLHDYKVSYTWNRRYIDTITLAYEHLKPLGIASCSLDDCRRFFGWSTAFSHTALQDAKDCRRLYYKLARASYIQRLSWLIRPKLTGLLKILV